MPDGWVWDESLFAGSAAFYSRGRIPYRRAYGMRSPRWLICGGRPV